MATREAGPLVRSAAGIARWDDEADVVIAGLGCAGACAALEARAAGADVLVLERASLGGGTSALSGGLIYLGGGTPVQKQTGFEDSPDQMFAYLMAACGPGADEAKVRLFCERSVEHFHWLVARGVPFRASFHPESGTEPPTDDGLIFSGSEAAHPFAALARPAPRGHHPQKEGAAGGFLMQKLLAAVAASGARQRTDARCVALVLAEGGRVVGAVARTAAGELAVRARRGVVLATGGFIQDDAMLARHAPWLLRCKVRIGCEGDDGSGIRLGLAAGAEALRLDAASISLPYYPPRQLKQGLLVNRAGQRFINEDAYYGRAGEFSLLRHDGQAWLIVDSAMLADPSGGEARPMGGMKLRAVGETIEELESELGFTAGTLQATVALYNRYAAERQDPIWHKASEYVTPITAPPYGAFDCRVEHAIYAAFTLGGLRTRASGAVLTPSGAEIPGLFAAGRVSSGVCAQGYSSGLSLADASFFGRLAGESAARA
jgi:succinate dehydrogenase/fumarate reductase flavoprotein subunit